MIKKSCLREKKITEKPWKNILHEAWYSMSTFKILTRNLKSHLKSLKSQNPITKNFDIVF